MTLTGMVPGPDGSAAPLSPEQAAGMAAGGGSPAQSPLLEGDVVAGLQMGEQNIRNRLVTDAYGTKIPQRRVPEEYEK
jgi:hypothetical protein